MEEADARRRFASADVARLATVRADGSPHLVPIVFAVDGDLIYSVVDAKPKAATRLLRLRNIVREPRVTLLVDDYDPDWRRLWWVRADGTAQVFEDGEVRERAIELLGAKYPQYGGMDAPFGPAMVMTVQRWSSWEFAPAH